MESNYKITTRDYRDSDYLDVVTWWESWKFTPLLKEILPDTGAITLVDGVPMFAAWLYLTNSCIHCITWFVRRKVYMPRKVRDKGVIVTFNYLEKLSKDMQGKVIFTMTANKTLRNILPLTGYELVETNSSEFIKTLR